MSKIKKNLKDSQDRKKIYVDKGRIHIENYVLVIMCF
jgi:hypothetical protein